MPAPEFRPVPVSTLVPSDANPRRIDKDGLRALTKSLRDDPAFLEVRPLIVNTWPGREMVVIAGNMRLRAAKDLGWEAVPCALVRVDPATERKWTIRDNASAGEWHEESLAEMLEQDRAAGIDIGAFGLSEAFIEGVLGIRVPDPVKDAAREVPTPARPTVPISRPGDLWALGDHRLLVADFAGEAGELAVRRLLGEERAAMAFIDPPYGVGYQSNHRTATPKLRRVRNDDPGRVLDFGPALRAALGDNSAVYVCCGHQTLPKFREVYDGQFAYANTIIWDKGNHTAGDLAARYGNRYEPILFYHKGRPLLRAGRGIDIWDYPRVPPKEHPTQKPVEMIEYAIAQSSDAGDAVLDCTAGSGSTLMAAMATDRRAFCGDVDPAEADVAIMRWMLASRQDATRHDGLTYAELRSARAKAIPEEAAG